MARVTEVAKARKPTRCTRCGEEIPKGSPYRHATPGFRGQKINRCMKVECRFRPSDLTTSKMATVYAAQEDAEDQIDGWTLEDGLDGLTDILGSVVEAAREVAAEYQEAAEAMGEAGAENQERADELESYADDLEGFDPEMPDLDEDGDEEDEGEEKEDPEDQAQAIRDEAFEILGNLSL